MCLFVPSKISAETLMPLEDGMTSISKMSVGLDLINLNGKAFCQQKKKCVESSLKSVSTIRLYIPLVVLISNLSTNYLAYFRLFR